MCSLAICMSSLDKCQLLFFSPFFECYSDSCMSCLYIVEINPLLIFSFAIIFFPLRVVRVVFSPCLQSPLCASVFKFDQVPLVYFCFCFYYSMRRIIQVLVMIYVIECSACVFPLSILISGCTFRYLIHYYFLCVYGVDFVSDILIKSLIRPSNFKIVSLGFLCILLCHLQTRKSFTSSGFLFFFFFSDCHSQASKTIE